MERSEMNPNEPELIEMRPEQTGMRPEWSRMDRKETRTTDRNGIDRDETKRKLMRRNETE